MSRSAQFAAASLLALGTCASGSAALPAPSPTSLTAAARAGQPPPRPAAAPVRRGAGRGRKAQRSGRSSPTARVDAANLEATREPSRQGYVNASQVYAWAEGALYRLYAAPERVSDIALQRGERLISVAAGDTARWVIGDTVSGAGAERRTHILVKPSATGLKTNLVIATDRRVYHVQLESTSRSAMASMSWTYPQEQLLALKGAQSAAPAVTGIDLEKLDFGYRISGDEPSWRPLRAFDDGQQVFIEFPPSLTSGEAPPLFVLGQRGGAQLVNYRLRGRYYVVDGLFARAELRLGERSPQVVRIARTGAGRRESRK